jgi:hypothetical protein
MADTIRLDLHSSLSYILHMFLVDAGRCACAAYAGLVLSP